MGLGTNKQQRTTFLKRIDKIVRAFGARPVFNEPYRYRMNSYGGNWEFHFDVNDGDFFSRFEYPDLLPERQNLPLNMHSGKMNIHWHKNASVKQCVDAITNKILQVCPIKPRSEH